VLTPRSRAGATLIELLVAVTVGGVVLALIAGAALGGQRFFSGFGDVMAVSKQLHESASIVPIDLRGLAVAAGDVTAGEARDTSVQLRETLASAVVCDTAVDGVVLAPAVQGGGAFAGSVAQLQSDDTAWVLVPLDTTETWTPHRIADVSTTAAGPCSALGPRLRAVEQTEPRSVLRLDSVSSPGALLGRPVRITRLSRYSLYRSSDGDWYLGHRDWNAALARFNTIQPVSGPFASPARGGLRLRYFDSLGAELAQPVANTRRIALIRATLRAETRQQVRIPGVAVEASGRRVDSVQVTIGLRNRR
jgi:hypothetical protein